MEHMCSRRIWQDITDIRLFRIRHGPPTTSVRAWQLYLKDREVLGRRTARDAAQAATLFRRALEIDDRFAPAWVSLADAQLVGAAHGGPIDAFRGARQHIQRALDCDPESGEARATLGLIHSFFEWDSAAAGREYRRAVELSPGYATAHMWYGNWLCAYERPEEGLAEFAIALDLDPLSPVVNDSLGLALLHLDRLGEAESQFRQTLDLHPDFGRARFGLAVCCARRGDLRAATSEMVQAWAAGSWGADPRDASAATRLLEQDPGAALEHLLRSARSHRGAHALRMAEVVLLMLLRRHDEAVEALLLGRHDRWLGLLTMYAPILDPLAGDPRFRRLMEEVGLLLPRWRKKR